MRSARSITRTRSRPRTSSTSHPALLGALDQPLADPAFVALSALSDYARRHVTVALGGEGADELFGGYPRYRWLSRLPRERRRGRARDTCSSGHRRDGHARRSFAASLAATTPGGGPPAAGWPAHGSTFATRCSARGSRITGTSHRPGAIDAHASGRRSSLEPGT